MFSSIFLFIIFQAVRQKKHKNTQHVETRPSRHDFCDELNFLFEQTTTAVFFPQSCSLLLLFLDFDDELEILVRGIPTQNHHRREEEEDQGNDEDDDNPKQ